MLRNIFRCTLGRDTEKEKHVCLGPYESMRLSYVDLSGPPIRICISFLSCGLSRLEQVTKKRGPLSARVLFSV